MPTVVELRQERAKLVADSRKLIEKAESEKRDLNAEERAQWDQMQADVDAIKNRITRLETLASLDDSEPDADDEPAPAADPKRHNPRQGDSRNTPPANDADRPANMSRRDWEARQHRSSKEYRGAFGSYVVNGMHGLNRNEYRSLQANIDTAGGFLVAPQEFSNDIIIAANNEVVLRDAATKFTLTNSQSMGVPTLENDPADSDWTSELQTGSEDTTMSLGKRELFPFPLAKRIKISNRTLRLAAVDPVGLVRKRLSYKFNVTLEKAYMSGTGVNQPLGVFTASSNGISTGRDVTIDVTDDRSKADSLISMVYSLRDAYRKRAQWVMHRNLIAKIRKLKDSYGQYLWAPGLAVGEPDRLLNYPVKMSEYAPAADKTSNTVYTSGDYVALFGALDMYYIVDSEQLEIIRLDELYAEANQVGFIARLETDGMPVLEEAFARGKLGGDW